MEECEKKGLEDYNQRIYVCDGFHIKKILESNRKNEN